MLGLLLEGGANRTYFSVGVLDAFLDYGIKVDCLVGVSAGIANGISYISGQRGRSLEIGMKYIPDKRYMGTKYFFKKDNRSYYNIDFIFKDIANVHLPFDYKAYSEFPGDVYSVVTNLETGKSEYIKIDDYSTSWEAVVASCALPFMFKPVKIGDKLYMDGGCSNPLPAKYAYSLGCDKLIGVLTRERTYEKNKDTESALSSFFFRKYPEFSSCLKNRSNIYNESRSFIFEKEKIGSAFIFEPKDTSSWSRTEKNPNMIKIMYDEGYTQAVNRMDELKEFIDKK